VAVVRGVLHALHAAHQHDVIHRDIKPANILISHSLDDASSWTEQDVKVTDFGLGKVGGETARSIMQSGSTDDNNRLAGTIAYMSPEQRDGSRVDARSDLYACGIVLFETLTGKRPAGNDLPSSLRPDVPTYLDRVFERSYTRWERRFTSAQEMLAALVDAGADRGQVPPPPPVGETATCPACRRSVLADDSYCIHCGQQLGGSLPRCQACRSFVDLSDRYCIHCGKDLRVLNG
jgi:serine/threonine-protein kinase